ncbi:MAG: GNAT family N-acetyltransferase [Acidobacteria bacterium]|nr:GNAT family N-acetyltransferase [Acidobacteriota bacterium]
MLIRLIHADESAALASITLAAYRQLNDGAPLGPYEDELADVDRRRLDSEVYVALENDATILGGVTYVPGPEHAMAEFRDPRACGIRMLAVDPGAQGRGVGRALVQTCIDRARAQRRERIILHSAPTMTLAQAMYVRMGFRAAPELDEHIHEGPDRDGEGLHLRAFTLTL